MALTYLATEKGLIDLRLPLDIKIDTDRSTLRVFAGMPHEVESEAVVMRIASREDAAEMLFTSGYDRSEPMTDSDEHERELMLLKLVAASLAEAIALATYRYDDAADDHARILEFTSGKDWCWTLQQMDSISGTKRMNEVAA